jgi:hypothetical protein
VRKGEPSKGQYEKYVRASRLLLKLLAALGAGKIRDQLSLSAKADQAKAADNLAAALEQICSNFLPPDYKPDVFELNCALAVMADRGEQQDGI